MTDTVDGGLCDLETGICALPGDTPPVEATATAATTPAGLTRITYITDPICSACWILEPAWRSVTLRYVDLPASTLGEIKRLQPSADASPLFGLLDKLLRAPGRVLAGVASR
jgi:hypothetical protein